MRTISMILMKERTSMEQVFQYVDQMFEQYVKEVATLCSFRSVKGDSAGLQACRNLLKIKLDALGFCPGEYGGMQDRKSVV